MPKTFLPRFAGRDVALHYSGDAYQAQVDQTTVVSRILSLDPPHARIAIDGAEEIVFLIEGETIHLARGGNGYSLENTVHAAPTRRTDGPADGRLVAPMNRRVVAVNAQAGDTAEAGRALVVLEAMKMEHVLSVPAAARVKAVPVAAGAQVSPGQFLVELEPS